MKLLDIAHSRTGDKGNTSIISLIPYDDRDFETLKQGVSAEKVRQWFQKLGDIQVERYEFPGLRALNFVISNALGGGVTHSLNLDRHGKALSSALLEMPIKREK